MMVPYLILLLFMVPVAALCWRVVVTKSRNWALRIGGAAAAMANVVGASVVFDDLERFDFGDWRSLLALAAAGSGTIYLLLWGLRHRTNQRHRTISLIAAIIGFVPLIATVMVALLYGDGSR